MTSNIYKY